ncbi:MAG TPA: hypothetical protein VJK05_05800 [archaeon]|nr:hypothetical protein [archaeon]
MNRYKFLGISILTAFSSNAFAQEAMPWDPLRNISEAAASLDFYTRLLVFLISLGIFAVSILAYNRNKGKKLFFVSIAFFLFSVKWLLKVLDLFISPGLFFSDPSENVFELLILASLALALFKR